VKAILKSVSRSFYLTIQFLPRPLREPVSVAYLLARATDTIADTAAIPRGIRLTTLSTLSQAIAGELEFDGVADSLAEFARQQTNPAERALVENLRDCFEWLERLAAGDRADVREVLETIVRGQQLDLERFGDPAKAEPGALRTSKELEEYTYLVAGCVGEFWTDLGFRHFPKFATLSPNEMTRLGIEYGKGLQLINILRDRGADLASGRDYLPAEELSGRPLGEVFQRWLTEAEEQLQCGIDYCASLTNWRVRFATALPALIGARTIAYLRSAGPGKEKVKVPRGEVRRILLWALPASLSPVRLRALFVSLLAR
jgi:farnesyl-diphosphate farnesyltransferase